MSITAEAGLMSDEAVRPQLELIAGGAGQVVAAETIEGPTYKYVLDYNEKGEISGARSWTTDPAAGYSSFKMFDAEGRPVETTENFKDGKWRETIWYKNGEPASRVVVDKMANTSTMTIHQQGMGDWVRTTPYEGVDGWTSTAPRLG